MKYLILLFFMLVQTVYSQNVHITGKIVDSKSNAFLPSANIILYHLPDSTVKGTTSDSKGLFYLNNVKPGRYLLSVKFIGYQTFNKDLTVSNKSINIGNIKLIPEEMELEEVLVIDKVPVAVQSGDTTVFNADAFKVNKDAVAQDLLLKIPGVQVENGKVKAQGEEVKKVYVDGKTFFGDDPDMALKNIPADIIQKVQVFDQQSDQSQFSGFNDGTTTKAINLITRLNISKGAFGKLQAGYGSEQRYNAGGDVNLFNENQRISVIGQSNNTNEQNFSSMDMLGVMGGQQPGGGSGPMGGEMGKPASGSNSSNLVNSGNGNTVVKALGFNYNNSFNNDMEIDGSYFYNKTDNNLIGLLNRNYFLSSLNGQNYYENNLSQSGNTNHRVNLRFDYNLDSLNEIRFIPDLSIQKNISNTSMDASTFNSGNMVNSTKTLTATDLNGLSNSSLLMYRHKFNNSGRSVSLGINTSYTRSQGNEQQLSENAYYNSIVRIDSINQLTNINNNSLTVGANLTYTEPINSYHSLMINAGHSVTHESNDKKTFGYSSLETAYSLMDSSLSNEYDKDYITNSLGVGYRYQRNKISFNANLNYNLASLTSEQVYPEKYQIDRKFNSLLPSIIFRYNISRNKNLNFFYRTSNTAPSVTQLQNILDNSNPLQLSVGNPDLKQEYDHFAAMRYSSINFSNMHTFFIMISGSYKNNYLGSNTIIAGRDTTLFNGIFLNKGSQLSTPQNVNGYISAQTFMTYGLPVDLISSNINLNLSGNYTRTPGILNNISNYSNSFSYGLGAVISSNISSDIDFLISSTTKDNIVKNSKSTENNEQYLSQLTSLKLTWLLFNEFNVQGELTHKYDGGLTSGYSPNTYLLNLSFGAKFFSDNRAELKITAYDMLNQNTNVSRLSTDNYSQEYSTNVIGRYYLLSFVYNLRLFS
ncbi:MAG: TonB-dependent receptor [Ignavibacteriaceae bacterium]|nr:TonB-dependent receptor [Ignavibacteriaceae bacterium]